MLCIISYYRIVKELRPKLRLAAQRCLPSRSRFHLPLRPLNKQMKDWCFKQHQARTDMLSKRSFAQQINPRRICCTTFQAHHFRPGLIRCATNQAKLSQMVGVAGKNRVFQHFLPEFCPVFCILSSCIHIIRIFWKEIGPSLLFLTVGTTNTKVRRSTGVATANSTNIPMMSWVGRSTRDCLERYLDSIEEKREAGER